MLPSRDNNEKPYINSHAFLSKICLFRLTLHDKRTLFVDKTRVIVHQKVSRSTNQTCFQIMQMSIYESKSKNTIYQKYVIDIFGLDLEISTILT